MALQPTTKTTNGEGLRKMNDIFDSMYQNLLKMSNSANSKSVDQSRSVLTNKQETLESNLLEDNKDNCKTAKKEIKNESLDIVLLSEQILELKKEIEIKDRIIKELENKTGKFYKHSQTQIQQMTKQLKFLSQNNQTLYRTTYKLEQQIIGLKKQLQTKIQNQKKINKILEDYQKQIGILKKINKQMLIEQKQIVKSEIQDINTFRQVRTKYEKQNDILKGKLHLIQKEREYQGFRRSLNRSIDRYMSVQNSLNNNVNIKGVQPSLNEPPQSVPPFLIGEMEVNHIKEEIAQLKKSVNELSSRKKMTRKKSMSSTPVKKLK